MRQRLTPSSDFALRKKSFRKPNKALRWVAVLLFSAGFFRTLDNQPSPKLYSRWCGQGTKRGHDVGGMLICLKHLLDRLGSASEMGKLQGGGLKTMLVLVLERNTMRRAANTKHLQLLLIITSPGHVIRIEKEVDWRKS